jgi:ribosomal protein S18 acetylase RimI-like enzyme
LEDQVKATEQILLNNLFPKDGSKPRAYVIVGTLNSVPVCTALYFFSYSAFIGRPGLYLEDLYVTPQFRGRGVGSFMFSNLAKIAIENNCAKFEWSVLDWNQPAREFYRKMGSIEQENLIMNRIDGDRLVELANNNQHKPFDGF